MIYTTMHYSFRKLWKKFGYSFISVYEYIQFHVSFSKKKCKLVQYIYMLFILRVTKNQTFIPLYFYLVFYFSILTFPFNIQGNYFQPILFTWRFMLIMRQIKLWCSSHLLHAMTECMNGEFKSGHELKQLDTFN
jgi:hypothetical protein